VVDEGIEVLAVERTGNTRGDGGGGKGRVGGTVLVLAIAPDPYNKPHTEVDCTEMRTIKQVCVTVNKRLRSRVSHASKR
jgi:hypothetical protein